MPYCVWDIIFVLKTTLPPGISIGPSAVHRSLTLGIEMSSPDFISDGQES